jgi:hypothetical protein
MKYILILALLLIGCEIATNPTHTQSAADLCSDPSYMEDVGYYELRFDGLDEYDLGDTTVFHAVIDSIVSDTVYSHSGVHGFISPLKSPYEYKVTMLLNKDGPVTFYNRTNFLMYECEKQ